jgi:hypothetical protein
MKANKGIGEMKSNFDCARCHVTLFIQYKMFRTQCAINNKMAITVSKLMDIIPFIEY